MVICCWAGAISTPEILIRYWPFARRKAFLPGCPRVLVRTIESGKERIWSVGWEAESPVLNIKERFKVLCAFERVQRFKRSIASKNLGFMGAKMYNEVTARELFRGYIG
jgi:hypothetical protein